MSMISDRPQQQVRRHVRDFRSVTATGPQTCPLFQIGTVDSGDGIRDLWMVTAIRPKILESITCVTIRPQQRNWQFSKQLKQKQLNQQQISIIHLIFHRLTVV